MKLTPEDRTNVQNGNGTVHFEHILTSEEMKGMNKMYAQVTLKPGCSIGDHTHIGNGEDYFILKGKALVNDNQEREVTLLPGEHLYCPDGKGHSISNPGSEDLVFMALIINSKPQ